MHLLTKLSATLCYKAIIVTVLVALNALGASAAARNSPSQKLIPPRHETNTGRSFLLDQQIYVGGTAPASSFYGDMAQFLRDLGAPATSSYGRTRARIIFNRVSHIDGITGENGLRITIKPRRITVLYTSESGLNRAGELLRAHIRTQTRPYHIPTGVISDWGVQNAVRDRDATIDAATAMRTLSDIEAAIKKQADKRVRDLYIVLVSANSWRMQSPSLEMARAENFSTDGKPTASISLYAPDGYYTTEQLVKIKATAQRLHTSLIPTLELFEPNAPLSECFGHTSYSVEGMRLVRAAIEDCAKAFNTKKICLGTPPADLDPRYMEFIENLFATLGLELIIIK